MFSTFERMVAFRYFRAKRKEGFISVITGFSLLGITLGVATLIVVMSVMNGFRTELLGRILGINGHITLSSYQGDIKNYDALAAKLRKTQGIVSVSPVIEGQAMATNSGAATGAIIKAMKPSDFIAHKKMVSEHIISGNVKAFQGTDSVIIGSKLAQTLGVHTGGSITLLSPKGTATIMGTIPKHKAYKVVGIFDVGMYEYDSSTIFMPLEAGQLFYLYPDAVNSLEMFTVDANQASAIASNLNKLTRGEYNIASWEAANASFFNALKTERVVMFFILTLIIVVAAFNIISSMIMLVNDKARNIAILRTMGATKGMILRIFFMTGAAIGIIGTTLGFLLGLGFAENIESIRHWLESLTGSNLFDPVIYYLSSLPVEIENGEVAMVVVVSLVLCLLATLYPAWKASRLNPAEALRYE